VLATQAVFAAAASTNVPVVYASSSSVYGDAEVYPTSETTATRPRSPYGVTKLACDHLAYAYSASFGLNAVGIRYFTIYGPGQRPDMAIAKIINALRSGEPFGLVGGGHQSRDFTYIDDAVTATILAMEGQPRLPVYNVGGGEEARLIDIIRICEELTQSRLRINHLPSAPGDPRRTSADTSSIRRDLGWNPLTDLRSGLALQVSAATTSGKAGQSDSRSTLGAAP